MRPYERTSEQQIAAIRAGQEGRLTELQARLFGWIFEQTCANGMQPSIREMGDFMQIVSPNGLICHLKSLQKKGYLTRSDGTSRGLTFHKCPDGSPFRGFVPKPAEAS